MTLVDIISNGGLLCDGDWIEKKDQDVRGKVRLIQLADIGDGEFKDKSSKYITLETAERLHCTFLEKGDILIARLPEPLGRACIFPLEGAYITAVDIAILRIKDISINPQYIMYLINSSTFRSQIKQYESGTTRKRISRKNLEKIEFSLPNLEIQNRIVARIEELFSKLDKAVDTLKTTKEQLTVYRQAVLKDAFSSCETQAKIKDVCYHVTDGDHMPPPKATQGIPFIMISNIQNNHVNWTATNFVGEEYYKQIGEKRTPRKGDILYTVTGSFGIPVMIDFDKKFCFQRHIALLRPNAAIRQRFLYYALQSPAVYSQATKRATGTAQKTVGLSTLRDISIPYTSDLLMQENIELEVKKRLCACDHIEKNVDTVLAQADAMRQSILKQAFEGKI